MESEREGRKSEKPILGESKSINEEEEEVEKRIKKEEETVKEVGNSREEAKKTTNSLKEEKEKEESLESKYGNCLLQNKKQKELILKAKEAITNLHKRIEERDREIKSNRILLAQKQSTLQQAHHQINHLQINNNKLDHIVQSLLAQNRTTLSQGDVVEVFQIIQVQDFQWFLVNTNENKLSWYKKENIEEIQNLQERLALPKIIHIESLTKQLQQKDTEMNNVIRQYENRIQRLKEVVEESENKIKKYELTVKRINSDEETKRQAREQFLKKVLAESIEITNELERLSELDIADSEIFINTMMNSINVNINGLYYIDIQDLLLIQMRNHIIVNQEFNYKTFMQLFQLTVQNQNEIEGVKKKIEEMSSKLEESEEKRFKLEEKLGEQIQGHKSQLTKLEIEKTRMIVDFEHQITELQSKLKELSETSELKRIIFKLLTTTDYQVPSIISLKKTQETFLEELYKHINFSQSELKKIKQFRVEATSSFLSKVFSFKKKSQ